MSHIYHIPIKFSEEDQGKYLGADGIFHSMEPRTITREGTFDVTGVDQLTVDIPLTPITIRRNGTFDVSGNDQATVFVSGQGDPTLKEKTVTENGLYIADDDLADGYSKVNVNLPNVYYPADEGKVVHDGGLVTQGSLEIIENGVYDTSLVGEVSINAISETYIVDPVLLAAQFSTLSGGYSRNRSLIPPHLVVYQASGYSISVSSSNNIAFLYLDGNTTYNLQFVQKIPKEARTLYFDASHTGNRGQWNFLELDFLDSLGLTGFSTWVGNVLKSKSLVHYNKTVEDIESQDGIVIHLTDRYTLDRQVVQIDISDITVDSYLVIRKCDSKTKIYGAWAK